VTVQDVLPDGQTQDPEQADGASAGVVPDAPADGSVDAPGHGTGRRVLQWVVLAVPVVALAMAAWAHRSMFYDGYIYLHVVQNVLAGHGPVFNAGQRVEAFTSPLWTAVLSVGGLLTPFPLTSLAVDLGILCTVGGLALAVGASARLVRRAEPDAFLLPLGAIVFAAVAPVWSLASLGLETGLEFLWLGGCLALLVRWAGTEHGDVPWYGAVVLGLGPLVRPELALDTLVFLVVLLVVDAGHRGWRRQLGLVAWALALPLAYELFRMGYYGMLVANTAVAKEASLPRPAQGVRYLTDFLTPYWLVVPAVALVLGAYLPLSAALRARPLADRNRSALVALPLAAVLNAGYIIVMGGDYVHGRLLMAPFFALCAPIAAVPVVRRYVISLLVAPWALLAVVDFRPPPPSPWSVNTIIVVTGHGSVAPGPHDWGSPAAQATWLVPTGTYLQERAARAPARLTAPPAPGLATPVVATSWVGQGPYELGIRVQVLDLLGLADPLDAHFRLAQRGVFPGHEKPMPTPWVAALLTAPGSSTAQLAVLQSQRPSQYTPMTPEVSGRALDVQTAWARAALGCPALHALEFGPDRPLTFATFWSDLVHAPSQTTLRVPADPEAAYHRFCGPGTPPSVRALGG